MKTELHSITIEELVKNITGIELITQRGKNVCISTNSTTKTSTTTKK